MAMTAVERDEGRKRATKALGYARAYASDALTPEQIEDYKREFPSAWADSFKAKRAGEMRAEINSLIEECSAPMLPNQVHREVEEQLRRNNLLLAAILKHLTRDL